MSLSPAALIWIKRLQGNEEAYHPDTPPTAKVRIYSALNDLKFDEPSQEMAAKFEALIGVAYDTSPDPMLMAIMCRMFDKFRASLRYNEIMKKHQADINEQIADLRKQMRGGPPQSSIMA